MCLAIPGKILDISKKDGVCPGRVEFGGIVNQVCLDFVPEAEGGDYVVVHVGFAISRVDREEVHFILSVERWRATSRRGRVGIVRSAKDCTRPSLLSTV